MSTQTNPRPLTWLLTLSIAVIAILSIQLLGAFPASAEESETPVDASTNEDGIETTASDALTPERASGDSSSAKNAQNAGQSTSSKPPRYNYIWEPVSEFSGCGADLDGGSWSCTPHPESCEAGTGSQFAGEGDALQIGNVSTTPVEGVTQRGTRIDNETGETADLGIRCALPGTPEYEEAPPVVITVTREDFARLPVEPLEPHAGPAEGWLPVNMVNVLYTEPENQLLTTELLGTPVAIRATPVSYHWDLGDGNTDNSGS